MSKKWVRTLVLAASIGVASSALALPASAADLSMQVNGSAVAFEYGKPYLENGRSLFPLRDLLVALGVENDDKHIVWDGDKQSVTVIKGETRIELTVGQKGFYRNGQLFTVLDVPAANVDGRVYLPARAVAEALGYEVGFDMETGTVTAAKPTAGETDKPAPQPVVLAVSVEEAIASLYGHNVEALSAEQTQTVNGLLSMDKAALAGKLVELYDMTFEYAQTNMEIVSFVKQFWAAGLQALSDHSIAEASSDKVGYKVNKLLAALPGDASFSALADLLIKHPNASVRYNIAFILSNSKADAALRALTGSFAAEKDAKVLGNAMAGAFQAAGVDPAKIAVLFETYASLGDEQKNTYSGALLSVTSDDADKKAAWRNVLGAIASAGSDAEKADAAELIKATGLK
ncbi:copper amine oxidase N-terminal domain-containing protein [Paenibacillus sp. MBLB4367]|uniref:copper amine oxidase N-terminal domain-containing protein n=1 Tax=Paenibacillus sp. MBLB4367 TaxID=3384767 RepID=UPI003907F8CD